MSNWDWFLIGWWALLLLTVAAAVAISKARARAISRHTATAAARGALPDPHRVAFGSASGGARLASMLVALAGLTLIAGAVVLAQMHYRTQLLYLNVELWGLLFLWALLLGSGATLRYLRPAKGDRRDSAVVALVLGVVGAPVVTYIFVGDVLMPRLTVEGQLERQAPLADGYVLVVDGQRYSATGEAYARVISGERVVLAVGAGSGTVFDARPADAAPFEALTPSSPEVSVGAWSVRAFADAGRFHACRMSAETDRGATIAYSMAPGRFAIMVRSPDWVPQKGDYDVNVGAAGQTRRVQATATPHGHVIMALHGDPAFEQSLSSAALLEVQPYDRSLRLRLPARGAEAFARLKDCATHKGGF
jgi:hypothetical protein